MATPTVCGSTSTPRLTNSLAGPWTLATSKTCLRRSSNSLTTSRSTSCPGWRITTRQASCTGLRKRLRHLFLNLTASTSMRPADAELSFPGEKTAPLCQSEPMAYSVKEIYYTLQGEGAQAGRAAVFCRFAGCNLWSGLERDRSRAVCQFCDTDFVGTNGPEGGKYQSPASLADVVLAKWPMVAEGKKLVVCTGGEPLLQLDDPLVEALHRNEFEIAIETNGTQVAPTGVDWVRVGPKADAPLVLTAGDELKLIFPQARAMPEQFVNL